MRRIQIFREYFVCSMTIKQLHAFSFSKEGLCQLALANSNAVHAMVKPSVPLSKKEVSVFC